MAHLCLHSVAVSCFWGFMSCLEKNLFEKFWHGLVPRFAKRSVLVLVHVFIVEGWKLSSVSREALRSVEMCIRKFSPHVSCTEIPKDFLDGQV